MGRMGDEMRAILMALTMTVCAGESRVDSTGYKVCWIQFGEKHCTALPHTKQEAKKIRGWAQKLFRSKHWIEDSNGKRVR